MSTSILEKLRVKPNPKKIEQIMVKIAQPIQDEPVAIQTKIVDKTKDKLIDRDTFISKLNTYVSLKTPKERAPIPITTPTKKAKKIPKKSEKI